MQVFQPIDRNLSAEASFEAWSGPGAGGSWSGAWLEVLTDNEAVLEAADISAPSEASARMLRLRVTRQ